MLVEIYLGYGVFVLALAYSFEAFKFGPASSLMVGLSFGVMTAFFAYKVINKVFVATLGIVIGLTFSIFIIELFEIYNGMIVYPICLIGMIGGVASFFKADEFFIFCASFVGSL